MNPVLAEMLATRRTVGESGKVFEGLGALSTANNLRVLDAYIRRHRPERTLEVGLSYGGSALAIADAHRAIGRSPARQHVALDPYQHSFGEWGWDNAGLAALKRAGLDGYMEHRSELSCLALPDLLRAGQSFGMVYIDGSHFFDDVFVDFYYAIRLCDGIVFLDDSSTPHVRKVLSFVRRNWSQWVREVDVGDYRPVGWRYRIAHRLGRTQLTAFQRIGKDTRDWDAALVNF
jgi:predicted O-methyltransferase YrrM